jgi:CBS domain-containing protein
MSLNDFTTTIQVKDVMSNKVITVNPNTPVSQTAMLMNINNIGSIIVTDTSGKPIGIITERDIVKRLVAKNLAPSAIKAEKIMSSPVKTISPYAELSEAARIMHRAGIRRLVVVSEDGLLGIVTSRDIIEITPSLIEIITEKVLISKGPPTSNELPTSGYCDSCGQWSDVLNEHEGQFLCNECQLEFEKEQ